MSGAAGEGGGGEPPGGGRPPRHRGWERLIPPRGGGGGVLQRARRRGPGRVRVAGPPPSAPVPLRGRAPKGVPAPPRLRGQREGRPGARPPRPRWGLAASGPLLPARHSGGVLAAVERGRPSHCSVAWLREPVAVGEEAQARRPRWRKAWEEAGPPHGHGGHPTARPARGAGPRGGAGTQECAAGELVRQRAWCLPSWPWFGSDARRRQRGTVGGSPLRSGWDVAWSGFPCVLCCQLGSVPQFPRPRRAQSSPLVSPRASLSCAAGNRSLRRFDC